MLLEFGKAGWLEKARRQPDKVRMVLEKIRTDGLKPTLEAVFDKLDADLAGGLMSLPAAKGVEVGSGFGGTRMSGLSHNDPFAPGPDGGIRTTSNHSGGIQGGISNGEDIIVRVAFKPTGTISSEQQTVTRDGEATTLAARGRHDPCVLPRAVPMVESMMLLTLADHWLRQQAVDVLPPLPDVP